MSPSGCGAPMSNLESYFTRRLLETLSLADEAADGEERTVHLRACRYYRDILQVPNTRRAERLKVHLPTVLHKKDHPSAETVVADISTYGFRVRACSWLEQDAHFTVQFDGLAELPAKVVWRIDDWAGCAFMNPLHPALLEAAIALSKPELGPLAH